MKKHILVIDDEADICELLREALTLKGWRVSTAADPERARKIVRQDPPHLIIMDFQIGEGDGFVLIEDIKTFAPAIPIMLLTGALFDRNAVRVAIEKRVDRYLDKTASLSMIASEIELLLKGSPAPPAPPRQP